MFSNLRFISLSGIIVWVTPFVNTSLPLEVQISKGLSSPFHQTRYGTWTWTWTRYTRTNTTGFRADSSSIYEYYASAGAHAMPGIALANAYCDELLKSQPTVLRLSAIGGLPIVLEITVEIPAYSGRRGCMRVEAQYSTAVQRHIPCAN